MIQYLKALEYILENGTPREDRTGTGTIGVFGYQMRFNLSEGFPAVTTKKLAWNAMAAELLWFLEGSSDERRLAELTYGDARQNLTDKKTIWTDNADNQGVALGHSNSPLNKELGPVYGVQWRGFVSSDDEVDQIEQIVELLTTDKNSRRIILSAWNPAEVPNMALPPCHLLAQFHVTQGKLSCQMYQRSADMFLGVPFNIASYALLTHMLAHVTGLEVGELIWIGGDCHIYSNHIEQVKEQLTRTPSALPILHLNPLVTSIFEFSLGDLKLCGYTPQPSIKAKMAI
jgi:thymidylate synthase